MTPRPPPPYRLKTLKYRKKFLLTLQWSIDIMNLIFSYLLETKVLTLTYYLQMKSLYRIALYEQGRNCRDDFVSQLENRLQYCRRRIDIKLINSRSHHQLLRYPHPEIKLINGRSHHQLLRHPHPEIKLTIAHCAQGENLMIFEYSTMYMIHF